MKSVGIICEYNPFHNGHIYHLKKVKELCPDHVIVLIMSGNFLQRGDASLINKWDKTRIALEYGVDLVVELPFPFATQSADIFAAGSIGLLKALHVDKLVFGSECNDINKFITLAETQLHSETYDEQVKNYLDQGLNYPTALSKSLFNLTGYTIDTPNDILGLSYVREIMKQDAHIQPLCIKRTNNYHSTVPESEIASASSIRASLRKKQNIQAYVPKETLKYLKPYHTIENYYPFLKFKILTELNDLDMYQSVDEGMGARLKKFIIMSKSYQELIENLKMRRYTYQKISRMLVHLLCNFTKDEADDMRKLKYIRILGFSSKGQLYLKTYKKKIDLPILTNFTKMNDMLALEFRATCAYASILDEADKQELIESEYKHKPIMK